MDVGLVELEDFECFLGEDSSSHLNCVTMLRLLTTLFEWYELFKIRTELLFHFFLLFNFFFLHLFSLFFFLLTRHIYHCDISITLNFDLPNRLHLLCHLLYKLSQF